MPTSRLVRLVTIPSDDRSFARLVRRAADKYDVVDEAGLARRLRLRFPDALVRASELSGASTWYVYRSRRFPRA